MRVEESNQRRDSSRYQKYLEYEFEEETATSVLARRGDNSRPIAWRVAKRGTVFSSEPRVEDVDIFKDVTHLYRDRTTGKKRGRREWATTFWVSDAGTQRLLTSSEEAALTKIHFARCGCDSIQWANVEHRENRVRDRETGTEYPFVSEDLWVKHVGSKRTSHHRE
tara:strand:+ start:704 stop:1201 length:498 start_codon:yes stop_codon:yes gene_type:complete